MHSNRSRVTPALPAAVGQQAGQGGSPHVSASVAGEVRADRRIAVTHGPARSPGRRPSVAGAAAPKPPTEHVVGGAGLPTAMAADAPAAGVALPDGTSILFGTVRALPEPG